MFEYSFIKQTRTVLITAITFFLMVVSTLGHSAVNPVTNTQFSSIPVISTPTGAPLVMLAMSVDHQLFAKAYTDYSDLDGDGTLDTSYIDTFDYYGYFNSGYCYTYAAGVYSPDGVVDTGTHQCTTAAGNWSGNFLNWASMTRVDIVRKVLYGGLRSTDSVNDTILQRALLPDDSHAFVKVFTSADMSKYTPFGNASISLCNVTDGTGVTNVLDTTTNPPLIKVAAGAWPQWSSSEVTQCGFKGTGDSPPAPGIGTFTVRVKTCGTASDSSSSYCKTYGGTSSKPIGLLQRYGDAAAIRFGLLTGSYNKKDRGGVLRKNITTLTQNANPGDDEVDLATGQFINQASNLSVNEGIIKTLNRIRIAGWDYGANRYSDCNTYGISIADFKSTTAGAGRECRDWGNPISEIYAEALRYFTGLATPSAEYDTDDSTRLAGLNQVGWDDPMAIDQICANCAIILLSTGLNSFDKDQLNGPASTLPGIIGIGDIETWTNLIGAQEGINGNPFVVANTLANTNNSCTTKTVANLGDVQGLCPELPQLEGSYLLSGLAYYAKQTDLRTAAAYAGTQNVDTYTVALAESLPSFEIPTTSGNTVSFVPTCQANTNGAATLGSAGWTDCSLVDLTVVQQTATYGHFLIAWEDSYWGNDYDMDGIASIEYCTATGAPGTVRGLCPKYSTNGTAPDWNGASMGDIQIRVSVPQANAGNALRFGFTMNGSVGLDGTYTNLLRPGGQTILRLNGGTTGTVLWDTVSTFVAAATTGQQLENPLYYAAKYGNFNDQDGDGTPLHSSGDNREWDVEDVSGAPTPDGIPDSFFPVRNPANLEASMGRIFSQVTNRIASGTAAAVVANNTSGQGAVYQALYNPYLEDSFNNVVEWVGNIQAMFIDENGNLREDFNQNNQLDACNVDPVIEIFFDSGLNETNFRRYVDVNCDKTTATISTLPLESLQTIWNARNELSVIADPTLQRVMSTRIDSASSLGGRRILTSDPTGVLIDFDDLTVNAALTPYFNVATEAEADNIVNYVRGQEGITGFRSRAIDYDSDAVPEIWRIADIVHSTPIVVGEPGANYGTAYGDISYGQFKAAYKNRRQVVYAGGNGGVFHAFNGGFYNPATKSFDLTTSNGETSHPLGAELWGYVPFNLLPHLKWLTQPGYEHVYYIDGEPRVFDVNIFTPSTTHVNGWGTILVIGMRFGGSPITVDADNNGIGVGTDRVMRSAYIIFDVTNPEVDPVLLGEITDPDLGLTTSIPALVKARLPVTGSGFATASADNWNLIFGSGPTVLADITRPVTDTAKVFGLNLEALVSNSPSSISGFSPLVGVSDLGVTGSFVGNPTSVDWDNDFIDDSVYFGLVGGTPAASTGKLMRQRLDTGAFGDLFTGTNQPFLSAPEVLLDRSGQRWVFAGTGRLYISADQTTNEQQAFYGIKDPVDIAGIKAGTATYPLSPADMVTLSELLNTTDVQVFTSGDVRDNSTGTQQDLVVNGTTIYNFTQLTGEINANWDGWYNNLDIPSGDPSERNVSEAVRISNLIIYTSFQPDTGGSCEAGDSFLNVQHFNTGTAAPFSPVGVDPSIVYNSSDLVLEGVALGKGLYSAPVLHRGSGGVTVITQGSTGAISGDSVGLGGAASGRQSWRQIYNF